MLRYLMILRAATDFGLTSAEITAVAGTFDRRRPRCAQLAEALADLILGREDQAGRLSSVG